MTIIEKPEIERIISTIPKTDLIQCIEEAFIAYSNGTANVPPVGHLGFKQPPGDVHIKYGYITGNNYFVVKIASGFYENPQRNIPSSHGILLAFNAQTGQTEAILQDEGYLTDLRTAIAGAVATKYLAPKTVSRIGIVGTGIQARLQLKWLSEVTSCKKVLIWGRSQKNLIDCSNEMAQFGFEVETTNNVNDIPSNCNLIVTTTPATEPLIKADFLKPGTHLTAMGSDTPGKQELEATVLQIADIVACDSVSQCIQHGEACHAVETKLIQESSLIELGSIINKPINRTDEMITVADLTGIATQDIKITSITLQNQH